MEQCTQKERVVLAWPEYIARIAPIGVAAGLDICLSNWALEYITVSLLVSLLLILANIIYKLMIAADIQWNG